MSAAASVTSPGGATSATGRVLEHLENALAIAVLAVMSALPLAQILTRETLGRGLPGSIVIVQHLTLLAAFLGAALAARSDRLLALSTPHFLPERWRVGARAATAAVGAAITAVLLAASLELARVDLEFGGTAAWGLPVWLFTAAMPVAFGLIAWRLVRHASAAARVRGLVALAAAVLVGLALVPGVGPGPLLAPAGGLILVAAAFGMPIFAAIGGAALLLFWADGTPISAVPGEAYRMSTSPMLPAIPLFTLAGYILAAGGSSRRLLALCSALVGWMPGGIAVVVTLVLAFFTPLTGASGITILAIGGLLLPMLVSSGYSQSHALGLVTVSGSIGIFFPPSLPVILYAYYAEVDLDRMFVAGLVPGILLVVGIAVWGALRGREHARVREPFNARKLGAALWHARWEILLPIVVVGGIFGGFATLVEAAALTVLYAVVVECLLFGELHWRRDLPGIVIESTTMIGGFMIILGVALGLTNYLILAQIPSEVLAWVSSAIESPLAFLLALNAFLIVVGALMDIYSAIIVVVPLITPLAAAYGIHPVHLGVVFLANMELGYLMPPMGENLFLSAYRFDRPLVGVYRCVLPFIGVILAAVLAITFVPALSLWLVERWLGG